MNECRLLFGMARQGEYLLGGLRWWVNPLTLACMLIGLSIHSSSMQTGHRVYCRGRGDDMCPPVCIYTDQPTGQGVDRTKRMNESLFIGPHPLGNIESVETFGSFFRLEFVESSCISSSVFAFDKSRRVCVMRPRRWLALCTPTHTPIEMVRFVSTLTDGWMDSLICSEWIMNLVRSKFISICTLHTFLVCSRE